MTHPIASSKAPREAQEELPATENKAPTAKAIRAWDRALGQAHGKFCKNKGICPGARPLGEVLRLKGWQPRPATDPPACLEAIEQELLEREIYFGFRILPIGVEPEDFEGYEVQNYPSPPKGVEAITKTIKEELEAGILSITHEKPPYLSAIYAKDESNEEREKFRIITDFSKPEGRSVNDLSDHLHFTLDGHEDFQARQIPGGFYAKVDLKKAYRAVGVLPAHGVLLSFQWTLDGKRVYLRDTAAPFGLAKTPEFFNRLTSAMRAILDARGFPGWVVFFDDFGIVMETKEGCAKAREALSHLLEELGWTESIPKRIQGSQDMPFLGLRYESNVDGQGDIRVSAPPEKMAKAEKWATRLAAQESATHQEVDKAVGYFRHISGVVWTSRAFFRRLIEAKKATPPHKRIKITKAMRLDLRFWQKYARQFNGRAVLFGRNRREVQGLFSTDASDWGMGGFLNGRTFSIKWTNLAKAVRTLPPESRKMCKRKLWPDRGTPAMWKIHYRELFAVFWALLVWGPEALNNRWVTARNDNTIAEHDLNKYDSTNLLMMRLIRHCIKVQVHHNIRMRMVRITSEDNVLSDALSRNDHGTYQRAVADWREGRNQPPEPPPWRELEIKSKGFLLHRAEEALAQGYGP